MAEDHPEAEKRYRRSRVRVGRFRIGAPPGLQATPVVDEGAAAAPARLSFMRYAAGGDVDEIRAASPVQCVAPGKDSGDVTWVHVQGPPTGAQLQALGQAFGLHPLALEDVLNRETRPKLEAYETQQFVVVDLVHRAADGELCADQVSFFLGSNFVVSVNEGPEDVFEPVRARIRSMTPIRSRGADYLLYALLDVVVDRGFPLLEALGDRLEALEDDVLDHPDRESRNGIHYAKRELVLMRRSWWPQREVLARLMRDDQRLLDDATRPYLRDCYDHCVIIIDFVETYREMASSLLDTYMSSLNQRMNDIMKALTIIATIFLPLMFLTGLYGMNFNTQSPWNMPELHWRFGYFYALGVMLAVAVGMILWFRHHRWF
ncbi:MAG TPA: magnesium/cobalt transporter CorA [Nevskiaceae bacterium]